MCLVGRGCGVVVVEEVGEGFRGCVNGVFVLWGGDGWCVRERERDTCSSF